MKIRKKKAGLKGKFERLSWMNRRDLFTHCIILFSMHASTIG